MTDLQRRFEEDGFVVLESALGPDELEPVRRAARRLIDDFDPEQDRTVFRTDDRDRGRDETFFASATGVQCFLEGDALMEDGSLAVDKAQAVNKIGHALHDRVPEFTELCRRPLFGELLRRIGMSEPELWQTMVLCKPAGIGGEVRWHQDASYLITEPSTVVGIWIALEDATRDNGCLWMRPGAHRSPLRERYTVDWERRSGELATIDETPWPTVEDAVPIEVAAGGLVVFHDHMPHRSARNVSSASRMAISLHVAERSSAWAEENWLQRDGLVPFAL